MCFYDLTKWSRGLEEIQNSTTYPHSTHSTGKDETKEETVVAKVKQDLKRVNRENKKDKKRNGRGEGEVEALMFSRNSKPR